MCTIRSPILRLPVQKRTNRDHISNVLLIQVFSDKDLQHTRQESEAGGNQWMKWIEGDAGHKSIDHGRNGISTKYEYERRPRRRRPPPEQRLPRRRRRVWPMLLAGCGLGVFLTVLAAAVIVFLAIRTTQGNSFGSLPILGGAKPYLKEDTTQVQLATISQIQVCDKIGNVSIQVDPNAATTTVKTTKIVHVNNQQTADQEFQRIGVEVQPPNTITDPLTCTQSQPTPVSITATPPATSTPTTPTTNGNTSGALTVNINLPTTNGLLQADSDTVNIAIILPQSVLPPDGPTMQLDIEAPVGNITIDGISGLMNA